MKRFFFFLAAIFPLLLSAGEVIRCTRPLGFYRSGEMAEFYISPPAGTFVKVTLTDPAGKVLCSRTLNAPGTVGAVMNTSGRMSCRAEIPGRRPVVKKVNFDPEAILRTNPQWLIKAQGYQRWGNVVNEYYVKRFRELAAKRSRRLQALRTPEEARNYIQEVRRKIRKCFDLAQFPRTPLNARVTGVQNYGAYRMEKILFESRPGFFVTANLYLPAVVKGKIPGVIELCGHALQGKECRPYLAVAATLAANGMAVLIVDPVGQGERFQYGGVRGKENVHSHNQLGKKLLLSGQWMGQWRVWDAVRALDYLASRPEVDSNRLYVTGNSGGGTLSAFLAAVDDRLRGAAVSCYITRWLYNVENELAADAEQIPPGLAGEGIDIADFIFAADMPYLILEEENDFFDVRGSKEILQELRKVYALLGKEKMISGFWGPGEHSYSEKQRQKCYAFMAELSGISVKFQEKELKFPAKGDGIVTPRGQVNLLPGALSAEALRKKELKKIHPVLKSSWKSEIAKMLKLREPAVPYLRVPRPEYIDEMDTYLNRFLMEEGPEITGLLCSFSPDLECQLRPGKNVLLCIPQEDAVMEFPRILSEFPEKFDSYFTLDPFGCGSLTPAGVTHYERTFRASYTGEYHYASCALMLGESYLGKKIGSILSAVKLLKARGAERITLMGAGRNSVAAAFAALFAQDAVKRTILINPLSSYHALPEWSFWPQTEMPWGMLKVADLPEVYREIRAEIWKKPYAAVE